MRRRPGAAAILGGLILLELGAAAILFTADAAGVRFAGMAVSGPCLFRAHFGVPCPTCGLTRSVILTLHGHLGAALGINPAGPLWVLAAFAVAVTLLLRRRWVRPLALACGSAFVLIAAAHWVRTVLGR